MKSLANKKTLIISLLFSLVVGIFLFGSSAWAQAGVVEDWAITIMSGLLSIFVSALGVILVLVIKGLILIAEYQHFIDSRAVVLGWVIVRDLCNMFFVVVLMIIAFGTILNIPDYNYKKWLPKLILMAILINFSKTICGLLIDVAQVVMLTFVNAFKDVGGGNLTDILGIQDIVTMAKNTNDANFWTVVGAYILGVIYLLVAIVVLVTLMMMLVMRLVMIWIYVVLSPAAYLLAAFPGGEKYSSQWWDEFIKNLIVGPVLAFFIWLSLAALSADSTQSTFDQSLLTAANNSASTETGAIVSGSGISTAVKSETSVAGTAASTPSALIKFVVAIGMLVGGLMVAQKVGGAAGSIAGKGMAALEKGQAMGIKGIGKFAGRRLGDVRDAASEKMGVDLNLAAVWKRRNEQSEANRQLRLQRVRKKTLATAAGDVRADGTRPGWFRRKAALTSTGDVAWQNIVDKKHHILTAGSPRVTDKTLKAIGNAETGMGKLGEKKVVEDRIKDLQKESAQAVTQGEYNTNIDRARELERANVSLTAEQAAITGDPDYADLQKKEQNRTITSKEKDDLNKKRDEIKRLDGNKKANTDEVTELRSRDNIYTNVADRDVERTRIASQITAEQANVTGIENEIKKLTTVLTKNKLSEIQTARAHVDSTMEAEAAKKISTITNPDQLVSITKEAIESGDQGLVAAAYKKLTKTGNYNELHKELNLGTGYDGMIDMASHLQEHGGFSEQDARALVAEVGEIAKSVNHYQAFAPMSMDKAGQWQPTGRDQQQAAIFSELSKVQIQKIVRDLNRLAAGEFKSGQPHNAQNWEMSPAMIATIAAKDEAFAKQIKDTGAISMIQFIGSKPENIKRLNDNGASETARTIVALMKGAGKSKVTNPLETIRSIT